MIGGLGNFLLSSLKRTNMTLNKLFNLMLLFALIFSIFPESGFNLEYLYSIIQFLLTCGIVLLILELHSNVAIYYLIFNPFLQILGFTVLWRLIINVQDVNILVNLPVRYLLLFKWLNFCHSLGYRKSLSFRESFARLCYYLLILVGIGLWIGLLIGLPV